MWKEGDALLGERPLRRIRCPPRRVRTRNRRELWISCPFTWCAHVQDAIGRGKGSRHALATCPDVDMCLCNDATVLAARCPLRVGVALLGDENHHIWGVGVLQDSQRLTHVRMRRARHACVFEVRQTAVNNARGRSPSSTCRPVRAFGGGCNHFLDIGISGEPARTRLCVIRTPQ